MYRLNHSGDFLKNLYLDLIFNFITSEDITLFVYIGFDIKTSFSTFQTVMSLLTMNIHTVSVIENPNYYMFRDRFHFNTTLNIFFFKYRID